MRYGWILLLAILTTFCTTPAVADNLEVHGFMMGTYTTDSNQFSPHARLIISDDVTPEWNARVVLTPIGPLDTLSYAELTWKHPTPGIDAVIAGRTFPIFGRIWYDARVDQVPTLLYSDIYAPLAAVDTGATVTGHSGSTRWYVGGYTGDTVFGNDTSPSFAIRGEYRFNQAITWGMSQRLSHIPATGSDLVITKKPWRLTTEMVTSQGKPQTSAILERQISHRLSIATEQEWLTFGNRQTLVITYASSANTEVKFGTQTGHRSQPVLIQTVVRW